MVGMALSPESLLTADQAAKHYHHASTKAFYQWLRNRRGTLKGIVRLVGHGWEPPLVKCHSALPREHLLFENNREIYLIRKAMVMSGVPVRQLTFRRV